MQFKCAALACPTLCSRAEAGEREGATRADEADGVHHDRRDPLPAQIWSTATMTEPVNATSVSTTTRQLAIVCDFATGAVPSASSAVIVMDRTLEIMVARSQKSNDH